MANWENLRYIREEGEEVSKARMKGRVDSIVVWQGVPIIFASGYRDPFNISKELRRWNVKLTPFQVRQLLFDLEKEGIIGG